MSWKIIVDSFPYRGIAGPGQLSCDTCIHKKVICYRHRVHCTLIYIKPTESLRKSPYPITSPYPMPLWHGEKACTHWKHYKNKRTYKECAPEHQNEEYDLFDREKFSQYKPPDMGHIIPEKEAIRMFKLADMPMVGVHSYQDLLKISRKNRIVGEKVRISQSKCYVWTGKAWKKI